MQGLWDEKWTEAGYPLTRRYLNGGEIMSKDPEWTVKRPDDSSTRVRGRRQ